jgi:hypothetical protein
MATAMAQVRTTINSNRHHTASNRHRPAHTLHSTASTHLQVRKITAIRLSPITNSPHTATIKTVTTLSHTMVPMISLISNTRMIVQHSNTAPTTITKSLQEAIIRSNIPNSSTVEATTASNSTRHNPVTDL